MDFKNLQSSHFFSTYIFGIIVFLLANCAVENIFAQDHSIKKVVIDAGHGGKDPGAVGKKSYEKTLTLAISLKLGKYIKKYLPDVEVVYTRQTDKFVELHKRAEIANECGADFFISIHTNASPNTDAVGASTYIMGLHKAKDNFDAAKRENSVITFEDQTEAKYETFDSLSAESFIAYSLIVNAHQAQSLALAARIQEQFRERVARNDRGVRQAGLAVLWLTTMPSVLVETGFISNEKEELYLNSEQGQDYLASAIFRAFRDYKVENEKLNSTSNKKTKPEAVTNSDKVVYKIQIASSLEAIATNSQQFKGLQNVQEHKFENRYIYTVGNNSSLSEIIAFQNQVRKNIPDAYVVAFKNGKRINLNKLQK